jgi:16S rRNA (guanine966-N2)-methyltransferase
VRIISGKYKGRNITGIKTFDARPTTSLARESLFNILNNYFYFDKIRLLDLFSGSGSISFEFASRGCMNIDLVENNFKNFKYITEFIRKLNLSHIKAIKGNVFRFISHCNQKYDIIFADPPFDMKELESIPDIVFGKKLLLDDGWFVLEHSKKHSFKMHPNFREERIYGAVHFSIFVNYKELVQE